MNRGNLNNKSVVPEGREAEARPSAGEIVLASAEITISLVESILHLLADFGIQTWDKGLISF
jgi:hypothetical protein